MESVRARIAVATACDGASATVQRNLESLRKLGVPIRVFCWDRLKKHESFVPRRSGISYCCVLRGGGLRNRKVLMLLPLWCFCTFFRMLVEPAQLFFAHSFEAAMPVWVAAKLRGLPYVYHIHDNLTLSHRFPAWLRTVLDWWDKRFVADAFAVIVPAECRIVPYMERYRDHILVLPNVFPEPLRQETPRAHERDDRFTILALGTLSEDRGVKLLLEATRDIAGCRLLLAGHIFDESVRAAMTDHPGLDYRGHLAAEEAQRLYGESDCVFMFYDPRLEINVRAAPIKLGESLKMGIPVLINSETMISRTIVEEWAVGYRCAFERDSLSRIIPMIRDNTAEREAMSTRAKQVYDELFRWEKYEAQLLEVTELVLRDGDRLNAAATIGKGTGD